MTTGIGETKASVETDVLLHGEVPLIDDRVPVVWRNRVVKLQRSRARSAQAEGRRERQDRRTRLAVRLGRYVNSARGNRPSADHIATQRGGNESTPSTAKHSFIVAQQAPGKAGARGKIALGYAYQGRGNPRLLGGDNRH